VFCPPNFRGTNTDYVLCLLNNDCFSTPIKHDNGAWGVVKGRYINVLNNNNNAQ